jgi:hypothetical protein
VGQVINEGLRILLVLRDLVLLIAVSQDNQIPPRHRWTTIDKFGGTYDETV